MRYLSLCLALPLAMTLAACGTDMPRSPQDRLSVKTHEAVMSYQFKTSSAEISGAEQQRIHAFLRDLGLRSDDVLVVSVPKNRLPRRDAERVKTLEAIFASYPAKRRYVQDQDLRELPRSEPQGVIRVVRAARVVSDCGRESSEAGCATAHNLGAMIAKPSDLFLPQMGRGYYPAQSSGPVATADSTLGE